MIVRHGVSLLFVCLAFGCARRDHFVHYPAPSSSASVYVEPSAAPTVYNSTVTYETYAETYEEVWIDDPTYGRVLEICPATVDEWDGYNVVQQVSVTPRGQDLRRRGRFVYNGSWLWVPGFNPLPRSAVTFSMYHTLPRYQTYRRRHQPRRVIAPRVARARVRPRSHVCTQLPRTDVHVRTRRPTFRIHGRSTQGRDIRTSVRQHPTPEPDVRVRRMQQPRPHQAVPMPARRGQGFRARPTPRAAPSVPAHSQSVHVRGSATTRPNGFARPVQGSGRPDVSSRSSRSSRSKGHSLKRPPSRTIRSSGSSRSSRDRSARPRRR